MSSSDRKWNSLGAGTLVVVLLSLAVKASGADSDEFLHDFLPGEYRMVGQWPGLQATYSGTLSITRHGAGLAVTRHMAGYAVNATAMLETATADAIPVLHMHFTDRGVDYEETCLIHSDLDNYPRLTCSLYDAEYLDGPAGVEVLFPDRH